MKKIGVRLVNGFVLGMLLFVSVQTYVLEVGAYEINTVSGQLLSYDIEMDDDYGNKRTTECTCDACVEERAKERAKAAEEAPIWIFTVIICTIAFFIYCKIDNKKKRYSF